MSQINSRQITCAFWFNHWKNHNYASLEESKIGPIPWQELTEKFGSNMIVDGHINNWIEVRKHSNNERITEFPPHVDPTNDEKTLYRIHFKGADIAMETRYEILLDLNEDELSAIQKKYPTKETFSCDEECEDGTKTLVDKKLEEFKIWFEHWSGVDYANDLFDERPLNELVEEYGMDSLQYVAAQEWMNFYSGGGLIQDITVFDTEVDEEDKDTCIEMHFDGENMAQASHMLKDDPSFREQLEEVNDLYGYPFDGGDSGEESEEEVECRTPPKRKRDEDECPPAPKKAKLAYPRVIATTADGNIMENEDGSIIFPNGVTYQSEVTSVYSDSSMPGGVIDDNGCIKQDAPNLVTDGSDDDGLEDMIAENKAVENCQENHNVGCTRC